MRALHFGAAITSVLLAGVLLDSARAGHSPRLVDAFASPAKPNAPVGAGLLLQRADCTGNLRMLDVLSPHATDGLIALETIWYVGPSADSVVIRRALPQWARTTRLEPAPSSLLRALRTLGHSSTPTVIVLDRARRIRFISQSPRSPREFAGLRRIAQSLTWYEDL